MGSHSAGVDEAPGPIQRHARRFVGLEPSLGQIFAERNIHFNENFNQNNY
jgi:hypothetical protein